MTSVNLRKDSIGSDAEEEENTENPTLKMNGVSHRKKVTRLNEKTQNRETTSDGKEPSSLQQMIEWQDEWRAASKVLDRVIIIFSIVIGFVSFAIIFLQAPKVRQLFAIS